MFWYKKLKCKDSNTNKEVVKDTNEPNTTNVLNGGLGELDKDMFISKEIVIKNAEGQKRLKVYYRKDVEQSKANSVWDKNEQNILLDDVTVERPKNYNEVVKLDKDYIVRPCFFEDMPKCLVQNYVGVPEKDLTIEMYNKMAEDSYSKWTM